ncbi:MAG: STAS domain-containing protein [Gammaproteobacteria bacterium]|nr:STAS domain-containing protein [Gammaproteobacteria bacterium]
MAKTKKNNVTAGIVRQGNGQYRLSGELNFDSVPLLLAESSLLFSEDQADLVIDLAGIQRGNSAALGLMLEWMKRMSQQNRTIRFCNLPDDLMAIARVSDLDRVLPVAP